MSRRRRGPRHPATRRNGRWKLTRKRLRAMRRNIRCARKSRRRSRRR